MTHPTSTETDGHTALSRLVDDRMRELGLSVRQAAKQAHLCGEPISPAAVGFYRNGNHPAPSPKTLRGLAAALDLPVDTLQQAAGTAQPLGPWTPPAEADRMDRKQRQHVASLIKLLVRTDETDVAA